MNAPSVSALLVALIFIAGCRSAPPAQNTEPAAAPKPAAITDACQVLTPVEVSAALGVPIDPGKGGNVICFWSQTGRTGSSAVKLVLNFQKVEVYNREKVAAGNIHVTPVAGIGDEAISVRSALGTSLLIRKGDTSIGFAVRNMRLPQADLEAEERTLGVIAAGRI